MNKKNNMKKALKAMDNFIPVSSRYKILLSDINRNQAYIKAVHKPIEGEEVA
tara:strand:- start:8946 stop:9101 length:156 start_codon:yes stop_codon:yes gene_type:complete